MFPFDLAQLQKFLTPSAPPLMAQATYYDAPGLAPHIYNKLNQVDPKIPLGINRAARDVGTNPTELIAQAFRESSLNPMVNQGGKYPGLFGLSADMRSKYGVSDPHDVYQAARAAALLKEHLVKKHKGNRDLALKEYNAGEGNMYKYMNNPPFKETQDYSRDIQNWSNYGQ